MTASSVRCRTDVLRVSLVRLSSLLCNVLDELFTMHGYILRYNGALCPSHVGESYGRTLNNYPARDEELRLLRAEYFDASKRAAEAMQTGDHPLDVAALKTVPDEDARAGKAMRRIKEIYGV